MAAMSVETAVPLADYFNGIGIARARLSISDARSGSRDMSGRAFVTEHGARVWHGLIEVRAYTLTDHAVWRTRTERMLNGGATFMVSDTVRRAPYADPDGSILGASTPTVLSVSSPTLAIVGLPVGYVISEGDNIGVAIVETDGSIRPELYRATETVTAIEGGAATFVVDPPPSLQINAGNAVTLILPAIEMHIPPGSYSPAMHGPAFSDRFQITMEAVR
jgi:hypothetical protein